MFASAAVVESQVDTSCSHCACILRIPDNHRIASPSCSDACLPCREEVVVLAGRPEEEFVAALEDEDDGYVHSGVFRSLGRGLCGTVEMNCKSKSQKSEISMGSESATAYSFGSDLVGVESSGFCFEPILNL